MPGRQRGFLLSATILLLLVSALLTITLARRWEFEDRLLKERDLLWMGAQFRAALASYADSTPPGHADAPGSLEQLVQDRRGDSVHNHLRRIFIDPMTGKPDWVVVRDADGNIAGVHSASTATPVARDGLWPVEHRFDGAARYADWVFAPYPVRLGHVPLSGEPAGHRQ
ncbi:MAG: type II secretion system protein [Betaproteobacteria bacterium]|nr:type II secretion system protein [Betaproteobacteria bacterium]